MEFRHHKYTWQKPFDTVRHNWEFVGPLGGLNFHVSIPPEGRYDPSAGLEFHHGLLLAAHHTNEAPDHTPCPLLGSPCWHTGTSLYATEDVWPRVRLYLPSGDHDAIFRLLEGEARLHFSQYEEDRARA